MNLRIRVTLFTVLLLSFTILIISSVSIFSIMDKGEADIASFRSAKIESASNKLKSVVDLAYEMLETNNSNNIDLSTVLDIMTGIRYDGGEGYFWITDDQLPYPKMVMHAAKPQNEGKVMSDEKYNVVKNKAGKNLYQERVELVLKNQAALVDYIMVKPGENKVYNKRVPG